MTTKELMLGDYITLADCLNDGKEPLIFKVVGLGYDGENSALVLLNGEKACDIVEIDDEWCGIPITPEILEKNGFKRVKYGYGWKEHIGGYMGQTTSSTTPIEIMYYDEGHCVVSNPHIGRMFQGSIDSVHELQHCLKLVGINKDIVL